jgi:hypothetical protein
MLVIAVAYAHVLIELAAAVLVVAIAVRLLVSPARELRSIRRVAALGRRKLPAAVVLERRSDDEPARDRGGRPG